MNQITRVKRKRSITILKQSVIDMTEQELNKIDRFQTINRGFTDKSEVSLKANFNWEDKS